MSPIDRTLVGFPLALALARCWPVAAVKLDGGRATTSSTSSTLLPLVLFVFTSNMGKHTFTNKIERSILHRPTPRRSLPSSSALAVQTASRQDFRHDPFSIPPRSHYTISTGRSRKEFDGLLG